MNNNMYSQTDSRWRKKKYPSGKYTVGGSGCGLCAATHVLIEQKKYAKADPRTFYSYMRQYATQGHGTKWVGITNGLKHFGYKSVKELECKSSKAKVYKEFNKGNRMAVALFSSGNAPDGTVWTNGGHYIAFIDYKRANGKHYFYVKDSGGRKRRGWYCVETSMGSRLKRVWIVERIGATPYTPAELNVDGDWGKATTKLTQYVLGSTIDGIISSQPKDNKKYLTAVNEKSWEFKDVGTGSATIKKMQRLLNDNGAKLNVDGIFGKKSIKALQKFLNVKVDGICGEATVKAWQSYLNGKAMR